MSVATVEMMTVESAQRRRDEVLASVGGNEDELRARAVLYALGPDELAALDELNELDYLLQK